MMTVHEVSELTGLSVRALHLYDEMGLLPPSKLTDAGYRLYDDSSLERIQYILLFRELEIPLKEIKRYLDNPAFDKNKALTQQIELLKLRREHLDQLIRLAENIRKKGVNVMSFDAFDTKKIEEYEKKAKETWGNTEAFREYETKSRGRSMNDNKELGKQLMDIIAVFGSLKELPASDPKVKSQVRKLQQFITDNYYNCTDQILVGLGQMYAAGGEMTENINKAGGPGTAEFTAKAIEEALK